ncbi:MAG: caspase family protein [Devosia sp.]
MRPLVAIVLLLLWMPSAAAEDKPLRGVALVIGEGAYQTLPALANPSNDAHAVGELLYRLGFDVTPVNDADNRRLTRAFERFIEDVEGADVALVYYSGHGIEAGGVNYLVPVDADASTPESAGASLVPLNGLLERLRDVVPVTIMLLDACRSSPFPEGQAIMVPGTAEAVPVAAAGLGELRGPNPVAKTANPASLGMVIGFAAEPGRPALDGEPGQNSPYAAALLKHFAAGATSFADIMTMVTEEVYLKTRAQQLPWTNSSLRRVLYFGENAEQAGGDDALIRDGRRALLMTIANAPEATRRYVETVAGSEGVPLDALYGMLKVLGIDTADPGQIEAQLKAGADRLKTLMASRTGAVQSDPELARLAGLAERAETEGAIDVALKFRAEASARAGTLEAEVDANEANLKADRLEIGETYAEHARIAALNFDTATAIEMWRKAIGQVEDRDDVLAAGYRNNLAVALMEAGSHETGTATLEDSVAALQLALKTFDRGSAPLDWARTQSNLGNVLQILGDRESDRSRYEAAAEAHLAALEELTRDRGPLDWATAENNLGNAYARIGENEEGTENLERAIEAFQAALEERTRERVPLDWAATNDNLGSALSSLGGRTSNPDLFQKGIAAFRASLEVRNRQTAPLDWAQTQRNLGLALKTLGVGMDDLDLIREGADAYRAALQVFSAEKTPEDWARTNAIFGFALMEIARREPDRAVLEEARAAFDAAYKVYEQADPETADYLAGRIDEIDAALANTP